MTLKEKMIDWHTTEIEEIKRQIDLMEAGKFETRSYNPTSRDMEPTTAKSIQDCRRRLAIHEEFLNLISAQP